MTVVLVAPDAAPACDVPYLGLIALARRHRGEGTEDTCRVCGWHWPCPAFFYARRRLITCGVPPVWWAS